MLFCLLQEAIMLQEGKGGAIKWTAKGARRPQGKLQGELTEDLTKELTEQ